MKSSKETMEKQIDILNRIKRVEPRADLQAQIKQRIDAEMYVKPNWIKVAAAILLFFFSTEVYLATHAQRLAKNDVSVLVRQSNNSLYND